MKKFMCVMLVLACGLLSACGMLLTAPLISSSDSSSSNSTVLIEESSEEEEDSIAEIQTGNTYSIPDLCEFTVNYAELKKEITPPNPGSFYTYYPEEDGKTYLDISISFKNTRTTARDADEVGSVKCICGDGYEYNGFSTIENSDGSDFDYTNLTDIEPLETKTLHFLIKIPNEIADDESAPISTEITILDNEYTMTVR